MADDEDDFTVQDPQHVLEGTPPKGGDGVPEGDSDIMTVAPPDPNLLKITRDGESIVIGFNRQDVPDEVCIAGYREQLMNLLETHDDCKVITFDVTGVKMLPSGMLGLVASLKKRIRDIEVLNPSKDVADALRVTKLNTLLKIRTS